MASEMRIVSEPADLPIMTNPDVIYRPESLKGHRYPVTVEPPQRSPKQR
jgi:hypothetical protein